MAAEEEIFLRMTALQNITKGKDKRTAYLGETFIIYKRRYFSGEWIADTSIELLAYWLPA